MQEKKPCLAVAHGGLFWVNHRPAPGARGSVFAAEQESAVKFQFGTAFLAQGPEVFGCRTGASGHRYRHSLLG
jgi:hypothetical protein